MLDFINCFKALTGYEPFHWQRKLYERLLHGEIPDICDIPTGLGKTSIIAIWLTALAELLRRDDSYQLPRRLVYVVDRRTVVDQATDETDKLIKKITDASASTGDVSEQQQTLRQMAQILKGAASSSRKEMIVALSTLRGKYRDNRMWCLDPTRPAIIIGTVDMIGSRLLFTGYGGVGRYHRSLQAGLLGQDTLIVVDEAHLSPTFVETARDVYCRINQYANLRRSFLMTLSATINEAADEDDEVRPPLNIFGKDELANDLQDQQKDAYQRLYADKKLSWLKVSASAERMGKANAKAVQEKMTDAVVECAAQYFEQDVSVVIYLNTVEAVNQVTEKLKAAMLENGTTDAEKRVLTITGEMRGYERDRLLDENSVLANCFKRHKERAGQDGCYFLVATAAAEVGINFDADHGVCDLVALERMIQRFGRINRFGDGTAKITVVFDEQSFQARARASREEKETAAAAKGGIKPLEPTAYHTYLLLQSHAAADGAIDVSPVALRSLELDKGALTAPPVRPPLDVARIDDWSLTSLRQDEYPRPLVAYWLRGVTSDDTIQTAFCWRADLRYAVSESDDAALDTAVSMVKAIPIAPRERAEVAIHRAIALVKELAKASPEAIVVLIDANGGFTSFKLSSLQDIKDDDLRRRLAFATLVLPREVGGLDQNGNPQQKLTKATKLGDNLKDAVEDDWTRLVIIKHEDDEYSIQGTLQSNGEIYSIEDELADETFPSPFAAANSYVKSLKEQKVLISFISGIDEENASDKGKSRLSKDKDNKPSTESNSTAIGNALPRFIAYLLNSDSPEHYLSGDDNPSLNVRCERSIVKHNQDVERYAKEICRKLNIESSLASAIAIAAMRHDTGKARRCWQRAIGNLEFLANKDKALAKSKNRWFNQKANAGYRHEFGSMADALNDEEVAAHPHRDLILHLIAAHHGYARPYFPDRAFDIEKLTKQENRQLAQEAMQRFARLQREYGWWQLAYLEALLKTADGLASSEIEEQTP